MYVRNYLRKLVLAMVFVVTHGTWSVSALSANPTKPNILIVVADDLGWGHVGWQNSQESDRWMDLYKENTPDTGHQLYWAAISHLDEAVGRVLGEVKRIGQRDNTIVVFFGDNGAPGQRNLMQVRANPEAYLDVTLPGGNLPLRGKKGDVYEGGIRTPALISWPAVLEPATCDTTLLVTDWMPTFSTLFLTKARSNGSV